MQRGGQLSIKDSHKKTKISALTLAIMICLAGGFVIYQFIDRIPEESAQPNGSVQSRTDIDESEVTEQDKVDHQVPVDAPRFVSVPDLGVEKARVVSIGLVAGTNQMDSPISIFDAGWFNQSEKPGLGSGALLMDGHNGGPSKGGIFDTLGELKAGAEIIVERGDGEEFTYKVVSNKQLTLDEMNDANNPEGMTTALQSAEEGKQGLNIITCVGNWLPAQDTFDQRVILRAVLVD
ncbi:class F sortase [Candidatus Saccharibacteria bacterium]|nr:class F sortase [Candidatus Saccharibacteria bacterium]